MYVGVEGLLFDCLLLEVLGAELFVVVVHDKVQGVEEFDLLSLVGDTGRIIGWYLAWFQAIVAWKNQDAEPSKVIIVVAIEKDVFSVLHAE